MEYIKAKTIVSRTKSTNWFGTDYYMNIYKGCCHDCIYCDSRSECYGINDFDRVRAKDNALKVIRDDLRRKVKTGIVGTGAMSDPYNNFEKELQLTRHALELISAYSFGVSIATKSTLITRDIDILKEIKEYSPVIVKMTITTADDELCKKIERNVAVSSERFKAIKEISDNGIFCGVLLMPILPFINDTEENILEIVHLAKANGARFIYPYFGLTLRANQRNHYLKNLDKHFPMLKEKYQKQYGNRYECHSPNAKKLYQLFKSQCEKLGLLYKMQDIIKMYKQEYSIKQMSLFD